MLESINTSSLGVIMAAQRIEQRGKRPMNSSVKPVKTSCQTDRVCSLSGWQPIGRMLATAALLAICVSPAFAATAKPFACDNSRATIVTDTESAFGYGKGRTSYVLAENDGTGKSGYVVDDWDTDDNKNTIMSGESLFCMKGNAEEAKKAVTVRFILQPHPGLKTFKTIDLPLTAFRVAGGTDKNRNIQAWINADQVYSGDGLKNLRKVAIIVDKKCSIKLGYCNIRVESSLGLMPDKLKLETGKCDLIESQ